MEKVPRPCAHMQPAFLPLSGHGVLKSLLENPLKLPLHHEGPVQLQEKHKSLEDEDRAAPQSAFLGPTLWDKTLPYDAEGFQLEYMDLDEFLYENIPPSPAHGHAHQHEQPIAAQNGNLRLEQPIISPSNVSHHQQPITGQTHAHLLEQPTADQNGAVNHHHHHHQPITSQNSPINHLHQPILTQSSPQVPPTAHRQPILSQNHPPIISQVPPTALRQPISSQVPSKGMDRSHASTSSCLHQSPPPPGLSDQRSTPSPIDPDSIQIPVGFEPDPVDLALSTVPGQEVFDPTKRRFSTEELKPQPMIKKARKVYMPEDLKDDRYWARRRKNNMAAKRSRDARRLKENQIAIRAAFLEKENSALRQEVADLRQELGRTNNVLSRYQARHGPV
ncbi:hypothetical protein NL108_018097 [Boleophthalmus pectinirostris]|uniref:hepatic leukemia factor-like n=1 Tax=Boleophthalmus pectinirostris TaxID=150288 RepID=UPI000A1C49B6|nr:hepatic leukemia factor-like [Boleophthalmus pectinirostris]KAJ0060746.1 hypothetical protein NL108_018097 [Boleophthalmus pectinirostris]